MFSLNRRGVSPVIAIVLLLMMTVAAAGAAYFWLTSMQSSMQESSRKSIENIMEATGRRVIAQATLCKPTYPYKGLKSYWTMDGYNSTGVLDVSGNNNFGTFEGTAFGTDNITGGQVGQALDFDGNDDKVIVPNTASLDIDKVTLSVWVYFDTLPSTLGVWETFLCKRGAYFLSGNSDDALKVFVSVGGSYYIAGTSNGYIQTGKWYHVVGTYNGGTVKFYINGDRIDTNSDPSGSIDHTTYDIGIGAQDNGLRPTDGSVDEPRIYDRALSENEIQELYDAENHSARRRIDVTVRNIGSEDIPKATWVANLKHGGTTVETDAYNASSIGTGELKTLKFYFKDFKPNTEYTIELQGTGTSTTVSC